MEILKWLKEAIYKHLRISIVFMVFVILGIMIFRKWIFTSEWPAGGDILGWISRAYLFGNDFRWLYTWRPISFGFSQGIDSMDFFLMVIHSIGRDAPTTVKILMFSSFLMAGFTMYAFAYHYTSRHTAALSASLIYCLNQWFFFQFTEGHLHIIFGYALAPLLFLLMDRALKKMGAKNILALALALSLSATGFHPQSIAIYGFFLLMFVVFYVFASIKFQNFHTEAANILKTASFTSVTFFLLSAFAFLPFVFNVRTPYYLQTYWYPIEDAYRHSYTNIVDAFTLRAPSNWGYIVIDVFTDLGFPIYTLILIVFLLAFCTVFFRRDRYTAFFAFSVITSTFIAMGPHPPFGYVFTWAWHNIPHFAVFRAANRMVMMIAFSNAFFVSVLVDMLVTYVQKRRRVKREEVFLKAKVEITEKNEVQEVRISLEALNKAIKSLHKFLYGLSLLSLILVFLIGFLSSSYFFSQGLQVYTPPQSYIEPYHWLAKQAGDYKVITINNSPSEWENRTKQESDFAFSAMKTSVGWGHDIGYDSSFIHDKPTLQNGGWSTLARLYIDYLRFRVVRQSLTKSFLKMMGPFGYKYVVLPEYLQNSTRSFFLQQEGYHVVYNQSSIILQNEYYTPRFFAVNEYAYIVGGLETFPSLYNIDTVNLNQTALIFVHQTNEGPFSHTLFNSSEALILVNSDIVDATMLSLKKEVIFIKAADYGMLSLDYSKHWASAASWRTVGGFVWGGDTLTTSGKNSIRIPFKVVSDGVYDIWIRVGFADNRGNLSVLIDGAAVAEIQPFSNAWSRLRWVNVSSLDLRSGDHTITLTNNGKGYNDVDTIAVVQQTLFRSKMEELRNALKGFPGRILYVLGAENTFTFNNPPDWSVALVPYEGYVLRIEGDGANISPKGNASASSVGVWDSARLDASGANDGDLGTKWWSKQQEKMPQWLQIEWAAPQELVGVRVHFGGAYAEDYEIQTWNGTDWMVQMSVTRNNELERYHYFPAVNTTMLRINVTSVTKLYDFLSIWELEAYTPRWASTEVSIPREGRYMLALRLASGPQYGTLNIKVDDFTNIIAGYSNSSQGFEWKHVGPIPLDAGSHEIRVRGNGKIDFDQMMIYSLKEKEERPFVGDLFKPKYSPMISYKRINPGKYIVHVQNSSGPFILVFSESYHPLWKAYIDGEERSPIPVYSIINGFFINRTGDFDVTISFTGQRYADLGLRISGVTLVVVLAILVTPSKVFKRLKNYIKWRVRAQK